MKILFKNLAAFSWTLLLASCGPSPHTNSEIKSLPSGQAIFGGDLVTHQSFAKHVVGIYNRRLNYWCTATLIGPDTLVAAAHCFNGRPQDHHVLFVKSKKEQPLRKAKVISFKGHPQYNPQSWTDRFDVGVARFEGHHPADYEPISLPSVATSQVFPAEFFAVGYGSTTARRDVSDKEDGVLRYVGLKMAEGPLKSTQSQFTVDQTQGRGVCFGDSGGPAFVQVGGQDTLVGIVSAVYSKDLDARKKPDYDVCKYNAIYVSVPPLISWIKSNAAELSLR